MSSLVADTRAPARTGPAFMRWDLRDFCPLSQALTPWLKCMTLQYAGGGAALIRRSTHCSRRFGC